MKIRTVEQLYDYLSDELAWRKKELSSLRSMVEAANSAKSKQNVLLRCAITLLYAHWEGFVKNSASAYLEFVSRLRLRYKDLSPNFIALGIRPMLENASKSNKVKAHIDVTEFFLKSLSSSSKILYENVVNTQSNLSSTVFREIIEMLGLDYSIYATKEKLIDEKLLHARNTIAHGNNLAIDYSEFIEIYEEFVAIMDLFRNQIDNSANLKLYRIG